jgi:AraC family transcriptional regulator
MPRHERVEIEAMLPEIGDLLWMQGDGRQPTMVAGGGAAGESGISVLRLHFDESVHLTGTFRQHAVFFQMSPEMGFHCRFADRGLRHRPGLGQLAIVPSGVDIVVDADDSLDTVVVAIDPSRFALAAAEDSALDARIIERFICFDTALLELARHLSLECVQSYPNGPLFWTELASGFMDGLIARHSTVAQQPTRGTLGSEMFGRLRDYIMAHLDGPIEVTALARMAGRSPFHFSRVFARSVGVTPHRYIVHVRLQRAIELMREGRLSLAEIAARTGFADQSHLTRWVRRVYGVSLTELAVGPDPAKLAELAPFLRQDFAGAYPA